MSDSYTPTQRLILDNLAARYRLGEYLFAFDARVTRAATNLEQRGLVNMMDGNVEHSIRLSLTDAGKAQAMSSTYRSPLEEERDRLQRRVEGLVEELGVALTRLPR